MNIFFLDFEIVIPNIQKNSRGMNTTHRLQEDNHIYCRKDIQIF